MRNPSTWVLVGAAKNAKPALGVVLEVLDG